MTTADATAEVIARRRTLAAEDADLAEYFACCERSDSDDDATAPMQGRARAAAAGGGGGGAHAFSGFAAHAAAGRLSLDFAAAAPETQDDGKTPAAVEFRGTARTAAALRDAANLTGTSTLDLETLVRAEVLSAAAQLPCTLFLLGPAPRGPEGLLLWEPAQRFVRGTVEPSGALGQEVLPVVAAALAAVNDMRRLQYEADLRRARVEAGDGAAAATPISVAHARSMTALLDCVDRILDRIAVAALETQADVLRGGARGSIAAICMLVEEWATTPRRCLNIFLALTFQPHPVDHLLSAAAAAQDSHDLDAFAMCSALLAASLWPFVDLGVRAVLNDVSLDQQTWSRQLPAIMRDSISGRRDLLSVCVECEDAVAAVVSESVIREACFAILRRLEASDGELRRAASSTAASDHFAKIVGDDERQRGIDERGACRVSLAIPLGPAGRLRVAPSYHSVTYGLRPDAATDDQSPPVQAAAVHVDASIPIRHWVSTTFLQPVARLAKEVQSAEVRKLLQTRLSDEQLAAAELARESPLVFGDVIQLVRDVALMGNWAAMVDGFVAPLVETPDLRESWWLRRGAAVQSRVAAVFRDAMHGVRNGAHVALAMRPPTQQELAAAASEQHESRGRQMLRALAAFRLRFDVPQRLAAAFPDADTSEAYSAAFSAIASIAIAQRVHEKHWKANLHRLKQREGAEAATLRGFAQCNALLLFVLGALLRFVRHEYHLAVAEFERLATTSAASSSAASSSLSAAAAGGDVASVEELRRAHFNFVGALMQTAFATRGTQALRTALETLLCLALDSKMDTVHEVRFVLSRVNVAVAALLAAIKALPHESPLAHRTRPLLLALTFNGFFSEPTDA